MTPDLVAILFVVVVLGPLAAVFVRMFADEIADRLQLQHERSDR